MRTGLSWGCLLLIAGTAGCYSGYQGPRAGLGGASDGIDAPDEGDGDDDDDAGDDDDDAEELCGNAFGGPPVLLRLTRDQYTNTVADLLGVDSDVADGFLADGTIEGFRTNAVVPVTPLHVEDYQAAAESLAALATENNPAVVPCDPSVTGDDACAEMLIDEIGPRAFRRPLLPAEREGLLEVFAAGDSFAAGARLVVTALLQSPDFLYRVERAVVDPATGRPRLDGYSLAARLSYLLWQTMPDDELFDLAAADLLDDADALEAQARRMLDDPRGARVVRDFHHQWLGTENVPSLTKDPTVFPQLDSSLLAAMHTETSAFVDTVVRRGDGRLETLLTARWSVMDAALAAHYGMPLPVGPVDDALPEGFFVADLPPEQRAGLLTHAGVLAAHAKPDRSAPILRGTFTRENILCTPLPDPPADVPPAPAVDPAVPMREQIEQHASDPACRGCHGLIDELGFVYEHYDGLGGYRSFDAGGNPIDASAQLEATDVDGSLANAVELAEALAGSRQVQDCVAKQWFRYVAARPGVAVDQCALDELQTAFDDSGGDIAELVVAIVRHPSFAYLEDNP